MNRRFLSLVFSAVILLCGGVQPSYADYFSTDFTSCSSTNLGNGRWQVSVNINTVVHGTGSGYGNTSHNYLTIAIPAISGTSMSTKSYVWDPLPIESITLPAGVAIRGFPTANDPRITLAQPSGSERTIPKGTAGRITFILAPTAANNIYPAAYITSSSASTTGATGYGGGWILPNKNSCSDSSTPPPMSELFPVDPEFTLKVAEWVLATADVGNLPDVTAAGTGYPATINNINNNNLCVRYVTAGVTNKQYALAVTNNVSVQGGRNLFTLLGPDSSQLFYNLQLSSNDSNTANNFNFPASGSTSYITLGQTNNYSADHSEMCWTPRINLFKNATTKEGIHSGTLNFIITPKA